MVANNWVNIGSDNGLLSDGTSYQPNQCWLTINGILGHVILRTISQEVLKNSKFNMHNKIELLNLLPHLPRTNELKMTTSDKCMHTIPHNFDDLCSTKQTRNWKCNIWPNAPVLYPTIHHSEKKCAHCCSEWCIVRYGTGALWDYWDWTIVYTDPGMQ